VDGRPWLSGEQRTKNLQAAVRVLLEDRQALLEPGLGEDLWVPAFHSGDPVDEGFGPTSVRCDLPTYRLTLGGKRHPASFVPTQCRREDQHVSVLVERTILR